MENWGLWLDLKILFRTIDKVVNCDGAYRLLEQPQEAWHWAGSRGCWSTRKGAFAFSCP